MNSQSFGPFLRVLPFLCLAPFVIAQTPTSAAAPPPSAVQSASPFSAEPYVIKLASTVITRRADGTGTDLYTNEIAIQSEAALRALSIISISYASQSGDAQFVYARVVHPDGTVQETPVSAAIDQAAPVTQQAPLYSDIKVKQLPIRSLRIGDTLQWQGRITTTHPEAPNQFWGRETFTSGPVILNQTVELHAPAGVHLTVWTNPRAHSTPEESTEAGEHIIRWHHSNFQPTVGTAAEAFKKAEEKRLRTPEEQEDELHGALPSLAYTTFSDWASVGSWYRSLATGRTTPDDAIKAKVAELTAGKSTTAQKADAVYRYVSTQIRYIGVDFGIGRFQPHTAAEVFANQYGDCKDKHTLLASMLSVLGLQADPVLIGAGIRFNPAVPSPESFNHVITHLQLDGKDTWLDATAEIGAWGALLYAVRDQQALVVPATGPATIAQTPANLPFPQHADFSVKGSLSTDLTSESEITLSLREDTELLLRSVLHSVSPADYGQFVQSLMAGMGFGGTTSDPTIVNLEDPSQPLQLSFHYRRVKEKDWGENRVTATFMNLGLPYFTPDNPPVSAIQIGVPRTETSTVEMRLPEGWSAQLPPEVHQHTPFANCDVTWTLRDGKLTERRSLTILQKQVPVADSSKYQSWFEASDAGSVPFIQLFPKPKEVTIASADLPKLPSTSQKSSGQVTAPEVRDDPKAADLVAKGFEAMRNLDLDTARKNLDEARDINPTQRSLWAGYAAIAGALGKSTEYVAAAQRELSYHPDQVELYQPLALVQLQMDDKNAMLETYKGWVKAAPDSSSAALALIRQLNRMGHYEEALSISSKALARSGQTDSDSTQLRLAAADTQRALKHFSEAADLVRPLLARVTSPGDINNISFVLTETGTDLPQAEAAMLGAIAQAEAPTTDWNSTSTVTPPVLQTEAAAANFWDTMGWVLYREKKFEEAHRFLAPAAAAIDDEEVDKHLVATLRALHRPVLSPAQEEQKVRTFRLGPSGGRTFFSHSTFLFIDGKLADMKPDLSDKPLPADTEAQLRAADFHTLFPPGSKAHLIRFGTVNCHSGVCELILNPLR